MQCLLINTLSFYPLLTFFMRPLQPLFHQRVLFLNFLENCSSMGFKTPVTIHTSHMLPLGGVYTSFHALVVMKRKVPQTHIYLYDISTSVLSCPLQLTQPLTRVYSTIYLYFLVIIDTHKVTLIYKVWKWIMNGLQAC